ncbi:MAG: hypothetical protein I4N51_07165 [Acinetobacter sp.]|nr:hypothetical protein [Acinetobacter sp.]
MSEIKTLEIPKWGLSMEEGTIAQWLIQEGEQLKVKTIYLKQILVFKTRIFI